MEREYEDENQNKDFENDFDENQNDQNEDFENNQDDDYDNITVDDYKKLKERNAKAEKALYELKKSLKNKEKEKEQKPEGNTENPKDIVKKLLQEERFYDKNPEAEQYRTKIEEYQSKGLSLDDAFILARKNDAQVEENRNVYGNSLIKGSQKTTDGPNLLSVDEYDRLSETQQNKYNEAMYAKHGKIKFK